MGNMGKIACGAFMVAVVLAIAGCSTAPGSILDSGTPSDASAYQSDFLELARYVARNHCGFYEEPLRVMSLPQYEALVQETYDAMGGINNDVDFRLELSWFVAKLCDGHTRIPCNLGTYAPIGAWWFGDEFVVTSVSDPSLGPLLYKRIAKIGGLDPLAYEALVNDYISADMGQLRYKRRQSPDAMLSMAFLAKFGLLSDDGRVAIEYVDGTDGTRTRTAKVACKARNPNSAFAVPALCRNPLTAERPGNWFQKVDGSPALYIQLNSLPSDSYRRFFEDAFREARERSAEAIILDIRNNGGGNSVWCDEFLSYIVDRETDLYIYKGWRSKFPSRNVTVSDGLARIRPVTNGLSFKGKVILLTSSRTFSSATFFAVAIKDNGLGTVIGEPVGNASIRYGYMADPITLSHTGLSFGTTHHVWGRALPGAIERDGPYIMPDELIDLTVDDVRTRTDRVFERALQLAGKGSP